MTVEKDILQQLRNSSVGLSGWPVLEAAMNSSSTPSPGIHLAVLIEPFLGYVLQGRKTVESRFSKHCIAPYQRIEKGDLVLLKAAGGPVVGHFTAAWIQCSELDEGSLADVQARHGQAICADEEFWRSRVGRRYVTLVGVEEPRALAPIKVAKSDRRGWIVLQPAEQREVQLSLL